jgi:guanylate kinase
MAPRLFVIVGPSGVGKSTIISEVRKLHPELLYSISDTTRPPRPGEEDGVHYFFMTEKRFKERIRADRLLEWKEVYGNLYGTPRDPIDLGMFQGKSFLLDLDLEGYKEVIKKMPESIGIFVLPPSIADLGYRLLNRQTDSGHTIRERVESASQEIKEGRTLFAYQVLNDNLHFAVTQVSLIIKKETT